MLNASSLHIRFFHMISARRSYFEKMWRDDKWKKESESVCICSIMFRFNQNLDQNFTTWACGTTLTTTAGHVGDGEEKNPAFSFHTVIIPRAFAVLKHEKEKDKSQCQKIAAALYAILLTMNVR